MSEPSSGRSLPWFRVDNDLVDHPKVAALADELGVSEAEAGWLIIRLWSWTMRYAARGRLGPGARTALGRLAPVHLDTDSLVRGLVAAGWLDDLGPDGWEVHDWDEHNGAAVLKAEKDSERKKAARGRRADSAGRAAEGRAAAAGNGTGRDGTVKEGSNANASTPALQLEAVPLKATRTRKPPDPVAEFERFKAALSDDERRVFRAYVSAFALPDSMAPDWGLLKFVRQKLVAHHVEELEAAIAGAGRDQWHREKGSSLRALLSDSSKVAQLAKKGAA